MEVNVTLKEPKTAWKRFMFVSWGDKKIIYKNKPSGFGLGYMPSRNVLM